MNYASDAQIAARPQPQVADEITAGLHLVTQSNDLQAHLYVPPRDEGMAVPLVVLFHGATGRAERSIEYLRAFADAAHIALFAPQAGGHT